MSDPVTRATTSRNLTPAYLELHRAGMAAQLKHVAADGKIDDGEMIEFGGPTPEVLAAIDALPGGLSDDEILKILSTKADAETIKRSRKQRTVWAQWLEHSARDDASVWRLFNGSRDTKRAGLVGVLRHAARDGVIDAAETEALHKLPHDLSPRGIDDAKRAVAGGLDDGEMSRTVAANARYRHQERMAFSDAFRRLSKALPLMHEVGKDGTLSKMDHDRLRSAGLDDRSRASLSRLAGQHLLTRTFTFEKKATSIITTQAYLESLTFAAHRLAERNPEADRHERTRVSGR